jgi:serine phosphatase RsbU (regulator of sigma subunit)
MSLGAKLALATAVLLAVVIGALGLTGQQAMNASIDETDAVLQKMGDQATERERRSVVTIIAAAMRVLAVGHDYAALRLQARQLEEADPTHMAWIAVIDDQARSVVVAASEHSRYPVDAPFPADADALSPLLAADPLSEALVIRPDPEAADRMLVGANIVNTFDDGRRVHLGQVRLSHANPELANLIETGRSDARHRGERVRDRQLLIAGAVLLLGILLAMFEGSRMARPLRALAAQAGAIAAGDFQRRVQERAGGEVGQVADSFNSMAQSLGTLLEKMAEKASLERELALARSIQELMSPPPTLHALGPYRVAGMCRLATQCGGDWWSYRLLAGDRLLLVIGDVTGHGMPAAMIAATARGAVEAMAMGDDARITPVNVLEAIDRAIRDVGRQELLMTCFALLVDARRSTIRFANAGHCFPYLMSTDADGKLGKANVLAARGNPLGERTKIISSGEAKLYPGDVLMLTTDGITDRVSPSGARFGERRLRELVVGRAVGRDGRGVVALRDDIAARIDAFGGATAPDDDMTLVICQHVGIAAEEAPRVATA